MTTFLRDENNNLVFNSAMNLVAGEQAIKLDIKNLLLMFKTEYPFNLTEGIPWYDNALKNNKATLTYVVSERILQDKRVRNIISLDINFKDRHLNIKAGLNTTEGIIDV